MRRDTLRRVSLVVALSCATVSGCGGSVDLTPTAPITRTERVWVDTTRVTPRTADYVGAPQRTLRVVIWQPLTAYAVPLLVMAHGFGGLPEKFDAFARAVAAAGFVVAAPAFPLTNENAPGGHDAGFRDFLNQPGDLSYVITRLLQAGMSGGDQLAGRVVPADVAVLGHSLGGLTVIGLTRKNCCRDPRVRASILAAAPAPLATAFGPDPLQAGPPTLIINGTADHTVSFDTARSLYDTIQPPRFLLGLNGAGHSDALESQVEPPLAARDAAQRASIAFLNAVFRGAAPELEDTLTALAAVGDTVQAQARTP